MRRVLILVSSLFTGVVYSQVGVGTKNPMQILHIDAKEDNDNTTLSPKEKISNDVLVTTEGKIGIGYSDFVESSKFEAKLTIESGTQDISGLRFSNISSSTPDFIGDALPLAVTAESATNDVDFPVGSVVPSANCIPEYYSASFKSDGVALAVNSAYPYYNHPHQNIESYGIDYFPSTNTRMNLVFNGEGKEVLSSIPGEGGFSLKRGNTYRLEAAIYNSGGLYYTSKGVLEYEWVNFYTGERIEAQGYNYNNHSLSVGGTQTLALAYYTPTEDTQVVLKSITATVGFWPSHSYVLLQQVNPCN